MKSIKLKQTESVKRTIISDILYIQDLQASMIPIIPLLKTILFFISVGDCQFTLISTINKLIQLSHPENDRDVVTERAQGYTLQDSEKYIIITFNSRNVLPTLVIQDAACGVKGIVLQLKLSPKFNFRKFQLFALDFDTFIGFRESGLIWSICLNLIGHWVPEFSNIFKRRY